MVGGDNSGCTDSYRIRKTGNSLNGISGFLIYDGTDGYRCFFSKIGGKGHDGLLFVGGIAAAPYL